MLTFMASRLGSVLSRWRDLPTSMKDTMLAAVVTVLAFVPTLSHIGPEIGDLPRGQSSTLAATVGVALTLAMCLPLAVRSRWPAACLSVGSGAFAAGQMLGYPDTFGKIGPLLALYAAGVYLARFRRGLAATLTVGYAALALVLHSLGSPQQVLDFVAFYLVLAVIWFAGAGMRRWRAEEADRRRMAAELATSAERARIARELHDVVSHHVTATVVQADAAQILLDSSPPRASDGLAAISDTGRRALTELRSLLGILEATGESADGAPGTGRTPTLGEVSDLVAQARLAGQPVEWAEVGERRPRSADAELATYRVVQEGLTNVLRYANGQPTSVVVRHSEKYDEVEVTNTGSSAATKPSASTATSGGRGLAGLRERLQMLGGQLTAAPRPDGGFRLHAHIPSGSDS